MAHAWGADRRRQGSRQQVSFRHLPGAIRQPKTGVLPILRRHRVRHCHTRQELESLSSD